ncbi:MAG: bifunctional response regulator/alkaline phosphatase family protein [Bacteroidota bacterium]|nr:bifunctional response regulator/alkaline phosphatase family protein [Candidatus Kapabacteria bacterium]MCS7302643.1 bifunctional response regulator/alkaline phosphatase family protein [Candidatus Kapabacteria bacterium]MCX7936242.1 bifunctional response regulator/alkaline phosphatase family protein [Chlorobiota bacterium]MDW8074477.1 bifunctional response regulator/alkaline phosphatase family protein [Bacteroidota bacterium]MDW8271047.1 bifunctional response regulator/alkaline phosphatase fa
MKKVILWVDDEIDLLQPHIRILESRGYSVITTTSGEDAIALARKEWFDLVLLDEMMVGMSGLETLQQLKRIDPNRPVVMVTKNEQESLMDQAIGRSIDDYLTKPISPSQILAICKKYLDARTLQQQHITKEYLHDFAQLDYLMSNAHTWVEWVEVYRSLVQWSIELDAHPDVGLSTTLSDQWKQANRLFARYIERVYPSWLSDRPKEGNPILSPHIVDSFLIPRIKQKHPVAFVVVDCLRLDQWMVIEPLVREYFTIEQEYYCSILPTATLYARNSLFAGLYPADIERYYPHWAPKEGQGEYSQNAHEQDLLQELLRRRGVELQGKFEYLKIYETEFGKRIESEVARLAQNHLTAIVISALDLMAHSRSDTPILREIAPDEAAYRSLTRSWFQHSSLWGILRGFATAKVEVILTTDHGAIRCLRPSQVIGDRETSTCLRYKIGKNVRADSKASVIVNDPTKYRLPKHSTTENLVLAKEDYYFVYPSDYHFYAAKYRDSFQHGGISLEEMILPVVILNPK